MWRAIKRAYLITGDYEMKLLTYLFTFWVVSFTAPFATSAQTVDIPDQNLRTAIEEVLGKNRNEKITQEDMETLVVFTAENKEIENLEGFQHAINLQEINLQDNFISDLAQLREMRQLREIRLSNNLIESLETLENKLTVEILAVNSNFISDITVLESLINLSNLDISDNDDIDDLKPLSNLDSLINLSLNNMPTADLSPLTGLSSLRGFFASNTTLSNLDALAKGAPKLEFLVCNNCDISDISFLNTLTNMQNLHLVNNNIENIKVLANLERLDRLFLHDNEISDITPLAQLSNLITVDLRNNNIEDFSPLTSAVSRGANIQDDGNPGFIADAPKIRGPWLWTIVPTADNISGKQAANSGIDYLAAATEGEITETIIATQGAVKGTPVGQQKWKIGRLSQTGGNNINELANDIALGIDDINHHVAYGSIILSTEREFSTAMFIGGDDAVKVWLNGKLIYNEADTPDNQNIHTVDSIADNYQDRFGITLKKGDNFLLVAVYESEGWWSGFFGFDSTAIFDVRIPNYNPPVPNKEDLNGDGIVSILDMVELAFYFEAKIKDATSIYDLNGDNSIDINDLMIIVDKINSQVVSVESATLSPAIVQGWIELAWIEYDGSPEFQKGITYLKNLLSFLTTPNHTVMKTALLANYPNPFNPETWIPYQLASQANVTITIHSASGALLQTLELGRRVSGEYITPDRAAHWDGKNAQGESVASGVYFYTLTANDFTATRKMLIIK